MGHNQDECTVVRSFQKDRKEELKEKCTTILKGEKHRHKKKEKSESVCSDSSKGILRFIGSTYRHHRSKSKFIKIGRAHV